LLNSDNSPRWGRCDGRLGCISAWALPAINTDTITAIIIFFMFVLFPFFLISLFKLFQSVEVSEVLTSEDWNFLIVLFHQLQVV